MKSLVVFLLLGLFSCSMCAPPSQQVEEVAVDTEPVEESKSPPLGDPLPLTEYLLPLNNQPQAHNYQQQPMQMGYCYCPMPNTQQQVNNYPYMYMAYTSTPSPQQNQNQNQQYMMYWLTPRSY